MKQLLPLALASTFCTGAALPAQPVDQPTFIVRTGDLDLASGRGRAMLQRRIDFAVERACGGSGLRSTEAYEQQQACKAEARKQIGTQIERIALINSPDAGMAVAQAFVSPQRTEWP